VSPGLLIPGYSSMSPVYAQFGHAEGTLVYPGEYGAVGEIEIRQLLEPERSDAST
jgi:hypothetical protein